MEQLLDVEVAALSRQKAINTALQLGDSNIEKFYSNTTVFLTGGTGFLGKHLTEKLLRSCSVSRIYVLMRGKKRKSAQERLEETLNDPVFSNLEEFSPGFKDRISCVEGDLMEAGLGLSAADWEMLTDQVEVIFHCAATTRFDETLRTATLINVWGTREVMRLAVAAVKLKSLVHVSTAYSHATEALVEQPVLEKFYAAPMQPDTLINLVKDLDDQRLEALTPALIKGWPNTYTFCKAVAEECVRTMSEGMPVAIVRPGVVGGACCEPIPGWVDQTAMFNVSGMILGICLGVLHVVLRKPDHKVGFIPCDYVTNATIVAGSEVSKMESKGGDVSPIYNVTSANRNIITWRNLSEIAHKEGKLVSGSISVYYQCAVETSSVPLFHLYNFFIHIIPALLGDAICLLIGKKMMFTRLSKKVLQVTEALSFFTLNQWTFDDKNTAKLYQNLSTNDKVIFNFDIPNIIWPDYLQIWILGAIKYVAKLKLGSIEYGRKKQNMFRMLHYILCILYAYCLWKIFSYVFYCIKCLF